MTTLSPFHPKADEISETISEAFWTLRAQRGTVGHVTLLDVHQHDTCNHTLTGTIEVDAQVFGFICEVGDWAGFRMIQWGDYEDVGYYKPPVVTPRTFIPANWIEWSEESVGFNLQIYARWRHSDWFKAKEGAYNYDRHFQPGNYVENHYANWAATKGLKLGYLSDLPESFQVILKGWEKKLS